MLGTRALYAEDSIIYLHKPELSNPSVVNNRLGEWTDEVPNARIVKFVGLDQRTHHRGWKEKINLR